MPEISPPNSAGQVVIRRARTRDVSTIKNLVDTYTGQRMLLAKDAVTLYESVQEFRVAELAGEVIGCGALHVLWEDLGEIRTLAVSPERRGHGIGDLLLDELIAGARELGLGRLFALTFQTRFFARHGFVEIAGTPVAPEVYAQMRRSYDEGIAEFLDLEFVKPNTLGNSRMLLTLANRPDAAERSTPERSTAEPTMAERSSAERSSAERSAAGPSAAEPSTAEHSMPDRSRLSNGARTAEPSCGGL
ncbi:MAG TPA: amino-acid N-acetyltransferase [Jatrophihabitans sp.]|jgi:amino-acid N-acetyltransferase|nr:amino-acid N-acetyltransferase [Jatrophihabitans sp.]